MEHFFCKTKIIAGAGAVAALGQAGIQRLLLVADPFFFENGVAERITALARAEATEIFRKVTPDPSVTLAAEGAAAVRAFVPDTIVALGGGSAMDCAKAMAYFSGCKTRLIAIPTTSGSGSEVTDFAILTHGGVKHPLVDDKLRPDTAILDSELLTALPKKLIAEGGFDLISHALEAWAATGAGAITDALAADAFRTALENLPRSYAGDASVRMGIHTAATMAGIAFSQAGLGLCHAISHSLGGEFHIPHGRLNAILLPAVVDSNARICACRYAALARRCGLSTGADTIAVRSLKNVLIRLRRTLELPQTLAQAGIAPQAVQDKMDALVTAALADPCCAANPGKPGDATVRQILREAMGHG